MDILAVFNLAEAGLWGMFAVLTACSGKRVRGLSPRSRVCLPIAFLAFSISDVIEASTGAWWRPPGLLVLKGTCLVVFAGIAWDVWRRRRRMEAVR